VRSDVRGRRGNRTQSLESTALPARPCVRPGGLVLVCACVRTPCFTSLCATPVRATLVCRAGLDLLASLVFVFGRASGAGLIPHRGKHLDAFNSTDRAYITFNKVRSLMAQQSTDGA
jgi:hypothetical protein